MATAIAGDARFDVSAESSLDWSSSPWPIGLYLVSV